MQLTNCPPTLSAKLMHLGEWSTLHIEGKAESINLHELVGSPKHDVRLAVTFGDARLGYHPTPLITHGFTPDSAVQINRAGLKMDVGPRRIKIPTASDISQTSLDVAMAMFISERNGDGRVRPAPRHLHLNISSEDKMAAEAVTVEIRMLVSVWPNHMLKRGQWYLQEPGNSEFLVGSWETI